MRCPSCGFENPAGMRFCGQCGGDFTAPTPASAPARSGAANAERRHLAVMFCDLVGSTPLSQQLDPEDLRELIRAYQVGAGAVVDRFSGYIAQYLGDGLLIYFGYPNAHETDARRAVAAGLAILETMTGLNEDLGRRKGVELKVRIGIDSGLVVIGEMGSQSKIDPSGIFGQTPNVAARLQELAQPGQLVISGAIFRLIEGFFRCEALGDHSLKGLAKPIPVYEVQGESDQPSRLGVSVRRGLTPLIGREEEIRTALAAWEESKNSTRQLITIAGDAGVGKSRLVHAITQRVSGERHQLLECSSSPLYQDNALHPFLDLLARTLEVDAAQSEEGRRRALQKALGSLDLGDRVALVYRFLSTPAVEVGAPAQTSPQAQRQLMLQFLADWIIVLTRHNPVILVVEDLHWIDPSSLEFLRSFLSQSVGRPLFVLATSRTDFDAPWRAFANTRHVKLHHLKPEQSAVMVSDVAGGAKLPAAVRRQIVEATDGVPLFIEELTRMTLDTGVALSPNNGEEYPLKIPATLQGLLMERLDALPTAKEVAQVGAAIGRSFERDLVRRVMRLDDQTLSRRLDQLLDAGILMMDERTQPPRYMFKHALIQEAAYASLLKSRRHDYHLRIADVLERDYPELTHQEPERLAYHLSKAHEAERAIVYWRTAGQRAAARSANVEASRHLRRALDQLARLPDNAERRNTELLLRLELGTPLIAIRGYASDQIRTLYQRARELAVHTDDPQVLFSALFGLWKYYMTSGALRDARELAPQILAYAKGDNPVLKLTCPAIMGITLFPAGETRAARRYLDEGIAHIQGDGELAMAVKFGQDPAASAFVWSALVEWAVGEHDEARRRMARGQALARGLNHPFTIGYTLMAATRLFLLLDDLEAAAEHLDALLPLATQQRFPFLLSEGTVFRGHVMTRQGNPREALSCFRDGLKMVRESGTVFNLPFMLSLYSEAHHVLGDHEIALALLEEALDHVVTTGERWYAPEIHRRRGLLMQEMQRRAEARECFEQALRTATRIEAKSMALRAAVALARFDTDTGNRAGDGRSRLEEQLADLPPGMVHRDVDEARAILAHGGAH